jgi:hypothetical protein
MKHINEDFDGYYDFPIEGIFDSMEKAEKCKEKFIKDFFKDEQDVDKEYKNRVDEAVEILKVEVK